MWTALVRQLAVFLFTKRGKRMMIFGSMALLCFLTALLIDSRMYLTAGVTALLTVLLMLALVIGYFRQRARKRDRARQDANRATRRAAASQARQERFGKARSAVAGLVRSFHRLAFWRGNRRKPAQAVRRSHLPQ